MHISRDVTNYLYRNSKNPLEEEEGWDWLTAIP